VIRGLDESGRRVEELAHGGKALRGSKEYRQRDRWRHSSEVSVAKGGGVTLVEGAPVKWKKSRADMPTRPCSGQGDAFGASVSSLFIDTSPTKANRR
jgi:hypothetical protein